MNTPQNHSHRQNELITSSERFLATRNFSPIGTKEPNYFSRGAWLKRFYAPFNSWQEFEAFENDLKESQDSLKELEQHYRNLFPDELDSNQSDRIRERLRSESLAAKNRAEHLSAKSDFYPVYNTLITAGFGVFALEASHAAWKIGLGIAAVAIIFVSIKVRTDSRRQVAELKAHANRLDALEKKFSK